MGVSFRIDASNVDEYCLGSAPERVRILSLRKARAVEEKYPDAVILAADTVVHCDGVLEKPADEMEAAWMLRQLSGRWHEVYTGVCVIYRKEVRAGVDCTRVHFIDLSDEDISRYIQTGESLDKAGADGIQGMAGMFIDRIEGCPHNVMGLPMALTSRLLFFKE
jgi:septum formation protein